MSKKQLKKIDSNILIGNMKLNKRDLLMLWRFSTFNSVREVAQNPDILKLIFTELEPMFQIHRRVSIISDKLLMIVHYVHVAAGLVVRIYVTTCIEKLHNWVGALRAAVAGPHEGGSSELAASFDVGSGSY